MSANQTLMCVQNAQQLHADILHLNEALAKKVCDYPEHEQLCSIREKLSIMKVYLDEALDDLQSRQEIKARFKHEAALFPWVVIGTFLGAFLGTHFH
ncbi:MAG TPA: hypothetical protein VHE99_02125 [Gammaproteobacteria bacterium]|nr:hypothetical protein [Gammaproteobacteria bacterium]